GRGSTEGGRRQWTRSALVTLEVASALVLLVGASLLIRSFWRLQKVDPGFQTDNALTMKISLPKRKYPDDSKVVAFYQQLLEKLKALPGGQAWGAASLVPTSDDAFVISFEAEAQPPLPIGATQTANYFSVSADYFKTMGIPLLRGRYVNESDTADAP